MARMTGKRALMEMLRAEKVQYIFGNPGTSESPIMDALEDYPDLKYVLVLQEGVAMGMADAYARATGGPAFVNLHIETGLANGISLLNNSYASGTPLVLTAGNKDIRELAHGRSDLAQMARQFSKWSVEVTHPELVPVVMQRAFNEAKSQPTGPTFVAFSANALDGEADIDIVPSPSARRRTPPDRGAVEDAVRVLAGATDPVLVVANRVARTGASAEAVRVAELLGARVLAMSTSEMNFPTGHEQFLGRTRLGHLPSDSPLSRADVVLFAGEMAAGGFMFSNPAIRLLNAGTRLIHIDSDPRNVGSTQRTDIGIVADLKVTLGEIAGGLEATMTGSAREAAKSRSVALAEEKQAQRAAWDRRVADRWDMRPMSVERMMTELAGALPPDTLLADDSITSREALNGAFEFEEPGSIFGEDGGAIGWGIGGAMGLKLARPDRPVVGIVGDGTSMMTVQGLWTAANMNIPVVYVVCNNGAYRIIKLSMNNYKRQVLKEESPSSQYIGMDFTLPLNIAGMAEAIGLHGRRIEDPAELVPAVREALDLGKPAVLDVVIDGSL